LKGIHAGDLQGRFILGNEVLKFTQMVSTFIRVGRILLHVLSAYTPNAIWLGYLAEIEFISWRWVSTRSCCETR